jgi:hypothetical protein
MSQDQASTTRRGLLGAATAVTAATAATLIAPSIAEGQQANEIKMAQKAPDTNAGPPAASAPKPGDWSKPAAMAIPKGGAFKPEQGRYGLIYPRTPANYGFSILAKVKPGREAAVREYGKTIEAAVAGDPFVLAPLKLHYHLRHRLRQVYRGRSRALRFDRHHDSIHKSRRIPRELAGERACDQQVLPGPSMPELP